MARGRGYWIGWSIKMTANLFQRYRHALLVHRDPINWPNPCVALQHMI
jgi:hypothetical protein